MRGKLVGNFLFFADAWFQELSAVQSASQGDETAHHRSLAAYSSHSPQALLFQGSFLRQNRHACAVSDLRSRSHTFCASAYQITSCQSVQLE